MSKGGWELPDGSPCKYLNFCMKTFGVLPEPEQADACQRRDDDGRDNDDDGTGGDQFPPSAREGTINVLSTTG